MAGKHLIRRPHGYTFRLVIPSDLRASFRKTEVKYALPTVSLQEAKVQAKIISTKIKAMFDSIRQAQNDGRTIKVDEAALQQIVREFIDEGTAHARETFMTEDRRLTPADLEDRLSSLGSMQSEYREALVQHDLRPAQQTVGHLLAERGLEVGKTDRIKLSHLILEAMVELVEVEKRLLLGRESLGVSVGNPGSPVQPTAAAAYPAAPPAAALHPTCTAPSLKTIVDEFWNEREKTWADRTKTEQERCRKHLLTELGAERPIDSFDYYALKDYRDALVSNGLAVASVNDKYLNFASAVFNFAVATHRINVNPVHGLKLRETRRPDEMRSVFSPEELELIFCKSKEYQEDRHKHAHNFWVPLLALYTGARVEELCQLDCKDVRKEQGIWVIDINDNGPDKRTKTGERRLVPLHQTLLDLNFPGYVAGLPQKGKVFPDLKRVAHRYSHGITQWFRKFKTRAGIKAESGDKGFHSFRHTVTDHLKQKDIGDKYIDEMTGHAIAGESMGRYGKRYKPGILLRKCVMHLDYGLDLEHLKGSKWGAGKGNQ